MTRDFTVIRVGTDSSGRGIFMSKWMWKCWQALLDDPRIAEFAHLITVIQGAWMIKNGGGADDSEGYHDRGGCDDIRTWNLTTPQTVLFIYVASAYGFQFWRRDKTVAHGDMDPHAHSVFGSDADLGSGAHRQVEDLLAHPRRNGLAGGGLDYEARVVPIRLEPPARLLEEDPMAAEAAQKKLDRILEKLGELDTDLGKLTDDERRRFQEDKKRQSERFRKLVAAIGGVVDQIPEGPARDQLLGILRDEPDITGADNPALEV